MTSAAGIHVICALAGEARTLGDSGAAVWVCGVGPARARRVAERALDHQPRAVVSWGLAGGLAPGLPSGRLLVPAQVHDGAGGRWRTWRLDRPTDTGPPSTLLSIPVLAAGAGTKARLWRTSRCAAVDMESATIAEACARRRVPFVAVRAVADPAHCALPPWLAELVDDRGRPRLGLLGSRLARRPQHLAATLLALVHYRRALGTLRTAAAQLPSWTRGLA